jgi:hypothetical protein
VQCPKCGTEFIVRVQFGDQVITNGQAVKTKRVSTLTDEQRKAIGVRLQTARAAKLGLTLDQLRTLKIRPGQKPTAEQLAQVTGKSKAKVEAKPKAKTAKK